MTQFEQIARVLLQGGVQFVVIGGWAGIFHGLAHSTFDVDVVYARNRENIRRLVQALNPLHPYLSVNLSRIHVETVSDHH